MHLLRRREHQSNHGISRGKVSIGVVEEWNTRASSSERYFALRRCHKIKAFIEKPQATPRINWTPTIMRISSAAPSEAKGVPPITLSFLQFHTISFSIIQESESNESLPSPEHRV